MRKLHLACLIGGFVYVNACSLINAPDSVVTTPASSETPEGGAGGSSSNPPPQAGAPTVPMGMGGDDGNAGAAGQVGSAGETGSVDQDPGPGPNPTAGLLVLAEKDAKGVRYLTAMNGRTGKLLRREQLPVAAIAYDEASGRHLWFVFTASAFPANPTGAADLEVRRFDDSTGKWFVIGRTTALPPPVPDQIAVLNDRLVYLSHQVVSGKPVSAVTVLDTSDPKNVTELTSRTAEAGQSYVGVVGDRGSDVNADAVGGRLRLMVSSDCTTDCDLSAQQIFVGASLTDGTALDIDRFVGTPRFAKSRIEDRLFIALRSTKPSSRLVVRSFSGPDLTSPTLSTVTGFDGNDVGGFSLVECAQGGVLTDVAGSKLFAVQLVSGAQQVVDLGYPGAQVYTEPFGPSVISLDPTSAPGLRAFEVSRSGTMNLAVNERSIWQPDSDLAPLTGVARRAETAKCP